MQRSIHRRRIIRIAGVAVPTTLAGCLAPAENDDDDDGDTPQATVEMTDSFVFDPADLSISAGTTVVWENIGSVDHSVTAYEDELPAGATYFASGGFDAEQAARDAYPQGAVGGGETYERTFETSGTYEYFCIPHEGVGMTGTIEVA